MRCWTHERRVKSVSHSEKRGGQVAYTVTQGLKDTTQVDEKQKEILTQGHWCQE